MSLVAVVHWLMYHSFIHYSQNQLLTYTKLFNTKIHGLHVTYLEKMSCREIFTHKEKLANSLYSKYPYLAELACGGATYVGWLVVQQRVFVPEQSSRSEQSWSNQTNTYCFNDKCLFFVRVYIIVRQCLGGIYGI